MHALALIAAKQYFAQMTHKFMKLTQTLVLMCT